MYPLDRWLGMGCLGLGMLCTGCPNPNTYTTPRTAPPGRISHSIAAEYWGWHFSEESSDASFTGGVPTFPTYTLRVGIVDRVEAAARVSNLSSLGGDVKWNFLRTPSFDAAIDPAFQWFSVGYSTETASGDEASTSTSVFYFHAPLLLGFNVGKNVTIVASPGISFGHASAEVVATDESDAASATTGVMARLGVGFDFRVSPKFALHPEVTFLRTFDERPTLLYMAGLGFNFGALPSYDDVGRPDNDVR